jgi:hypothetical protein
VRAQAVHEAPGAVLAAQLDAVLDDIGADALKTGMLPSAASARAVAAKVGPRMRRRGAGLGTACVWFGSGSAGGPARVDE